MINTSQAYKDNVDLGTRATNATILFGVFDVTAKDESSITVPNSQPFTSSDELKDNVRSVDFNLGTFEYDFFDLDGSKNLMPDDISSADAIGWWSTNMSDVIGRFPGNLVANSDFSSGTAGWTGVGATLSISNGRLQITGNGSAADSRASQSTSIPYVYGKKVYIKFKGTMKNTGCTSIQAWITATGMATQTGTFVSAPVQNMEYTKSVILTLPSGGSGNINILIDAVFPDASTENGKVLEVQQVMAIDLTSMFNPGNEPNQSWCDSNLTFTNSSFPTLTINFSTLHSSLGIGLVFDPYTIVSDFILTWFNGATQLDTVTITGNTEDDCNITRSVSNWNKITIQLLKTKEAYRYAKILEINYGLEEVFTSDDITEAKVIEEYDPISSTITVNKLNFTVLNQDQSFNMLNPSGIYSYLQKRQQIIAKSGLILPNGTYENVLMGTYYLSDWKNSTGLTASLEATDAMGIMDKTTYYSSPFWNNASITTVLTQIINDAGSFPFTIDVALLGETITGYIPVMSHREAIQTVLISCRASLIMGRDGILRFVRADYTTVDKSIDYDVIIGTPTIEQKPYISAVAVNEYTYTLNTSSETLHASTFTLSGSSTIRVIYDNEPAEPSTISVSVTGSGSLTSSTLGATSALITLSGTGTLTLTITGKTYATSTKRVTSSNIISAGEVAQTAEIGDNTLITVGDGSVVSAYILAYYQRRIKQSFDSWDDPSIQSGDYVSIQTMFGSSQSGIVEHQEITFAPSLKGRLEVTG